MSYNTPDYGNEPPFYLDMTATGPGINPVRKNLDKDVYDSTYWDSKQIQAVIMPWIPYFTNCEGYDSRLIVYDVVEYNPGCILPSYDQIQIVNPIPSTGVNPVSDQCNLNLRCIYDEPLQQTVTNS